MQIIKRPSDALLAFLLGTAFGVMFVLSVVEMWLHNATQHGWPSITLAVFCGALLYRVAQPFLPDFAYEDLSGPGNQEQHAAAPILERAASGEARNHKEKRTGSGKRADAADDGIADQSKQAARTAKYAMYASYCVCEALNKHRTRTLALLKDVPHTPARV